MYSVRLSLKANKPAEASLVQGAEMQRAYFSGVLLALTLSEVLGVLPVAAAIDPASFHDEPFVRWERLSYRGVHMVEAFLIRKSDDTLVGRSAPFYVVIE